jgi:hypothetical protein
MSRMADGRRGAVHRVLISEDLPVGERVDLNTEEERRATESHRSSSVSSVRGYTT